MKYIFLTNFVFNLEASPKNYAPDTIFSFPEVMFRVSLPASKQVFLSPHLPFLSLSDTGNWWGPKLLLKVKGFKGFRGIFQATEVKKEILDSLKQTQLSSFSLS